MESQNWIHFDRLSDAYMNGVEALLDKVFSRTAIGDEISCPCKKCQCRYWFRRKDVYEHLIVEGFMKGYKEEIFHGEELASGRVNNDKVEVVMHDDIDGLLYDTFRDASVQPDSNIGAEGPNVEAEKFYKLLEEGQQELYPGCKNFSKLSFTIRLYLLKCLHGLSNVAFGEILDLIKEAFPYAKVPNSFNEAKTMVNDLGLDYKKIHACPNDCILFWDKHEREQICPVCGASRWKKINDSKGNDVSPLSLKKNKVPAKVLRYFPLKSRLQRLFMCPETADDMVWHVKHRPKDDNIRHPADGQAWKEFDLLHPNFANDPRNVRLGLASDGFNPFRTMSISYSVWPVVLINYNLAPWLCMKPEYMMLSMLIPGPSSPGRDIDVFLQPLIEELQELWELGCDTYDASKKQSFKMHAALLWTINDFPAYAMLSGWSTKGKLACPICNYDTCSQYLHHSKKVCYMGHRRFLNPNHPWRRDRKSFNGQIELKTTPLPLDGTQILSNLYGFDNQFGKSQKKNFDGPWKKQSIFFCLPYWKSNKCRHNLDVMHIEKNICDSILGTLLDIPGKTKDHVKSRFDLRDMGIRRELQPILSEDGQHLLLSKACFSMTLEEKKRFCTVLKSAKLPLGCASNISRCVNDKERKIVGYKSHDAHFLMHYLLQVAVRKTVPKHVAMALMRLGSFFKAICSKTVKAQDLDHLQEEISETLCQLEMIFPPSFFDIMVHLPIHLVDEIRLGGPVHCRWMFGIERYLCKLKAYVRNRSHPEGSMAEGYLAEECLVFCSRYLHDGVKTRFSRYTKKCESVRFEKTPLFAHKGHAIGGKRKRKGRAVSLDIRSLEQAHRYVLFNCGDEEVESYIEKHKEFLCGRQRNRWARAQNHSQDFAIWFENEVKNKQVPGYIKCLSTGPNPIVTRYAGYFINGHRFHTKERDARCKTQNSGVTLNALTNSFASSRDGNPSIGDVTYYGAIAEIIKLDYWGQFDVVLFRCDWFQLDNDDYGLTRVNSNKLCYPNDPFVLACQVHQVFYVEDPIEKGMYYVMKRIPRDLFDSVEEESENAQDIFWGEPYESGHNVQSIYSNEQNTWIREGLPSTRVDLNTNNLQSEIVQFSEESDVDDTVWDYFDSTD